MPKPTLAAVEAAIEVLVSIGYTEDDTFQLSVPARERITATHETLAWLLRQSDFCAWLAADNPDYVKSTEYEPIPDYIWRDPQSDGWIDAWNGWYETLEQALDEAAAGVGTPWRLKRGQGLLPAE